MDTLNKPSDLKPEINQQILESPLLDNSNVEIGDTISNKRQALVGLKSIIDQATRSKDTQEPNTCPEKDKLKDATPSQ